MCSADIFLGILAILFPPLPVWVKTGLCSADSIINILLCMLGYIPGLIHAWYIIAKFPEPSYEYETVPQDAEGGHGRVTYVIVHENGRRTRRPQQPQPQQQQPKPSGNMSYGTTAAPNKNGGGGAAAGSSSAPPPQTNDNGGEGRSDGAPPPSYAQVVAGDNKVQNHD